MTIESIISYLNEVTGVNHDSKDANTIKCLNELISKGYDYDDFKCVIDKKWMEWKGTKFEMYVRPYTLFGSKFEKYLYAQPRFKSRIHQYASAVGKAKSTYWRMDKH